MKKPTIWFYVKPDGKAVRVAFARVVPPTGYQRSSGLVVDQCPYCTRPHNHTLSSTDGSTIFGMRAADCGGGEYLVVDKDAIPTLDPRKFIERYEVWGDIEPPIEATVTVKGSVNQFNDFIGNAQIYGIAADQLKPVGWTFYARLDNEDHTKIFADSPSNDAVEFTALSWQLAPGETIPKHARIHRPD